jgi:hypothetical protein
MDINPAELPPPPPEIEIVDEEPSFALVDAAAVALADLEAGRVVRCDSDEAFEALLDIVGTVRKAS